MAHHPSTPALAPPWTPQQLYTFTGTLNDPDEPHQKLQFDVLAGDGAPVPTGGWAQIQNISRPRRKAFTQVTGYDPVGMDVPIMFEATVNYGSGAKIPSQLEDDIKKLEWMAGRGKLYANGTHPAQGNPPIVQVSSFRPGGHSVTNLIPPNFHSNGARDLRWLISNLSYDSGAIRNIGGSRKQQKITVSLIEYVAPPGAPASPRERQHGRGRASGFRTFRTTQAVDTIALVCIRFCLINSPSKWRNVLEFNRKRLRVHSYTKRLKPGTVVHVPKADF